MDGMPFRPTAMTALVSESCRAVYDTSRIFPAEMYAASRFWSVRPLPSSGKERILGEQPVADAAVL